MRPPRAAAKDDDPPTAVRPIGKSKNGFEGFAADDEGVDSGHEFSIAVRLTAIAGKKSYAPSRRAMKPSRLTPTKTEVIMVGGFLVSMRRSYLSVVPADSSNAVGALANQGQKFRARFFFVAEASQHR